MTLTLAATRAPTAPGLWAGLRRTGQAAQPRLRAPQPPRRQPCRATRLLCRAQQKEGEPRAEVEHQEGILDKQSFQQLAKLVAGKLAAELVGQAEAGHKLQTWLEEVSHAPVGEPQGGELEGRAEQPVGDKGGAQEGEPSTMHKVARAAARFFGARPTPAEQPLYQTASELLGVDSMNLGHVAEWLTDPSAAAKRDDTKLVGAIVSGLLRAYESNTGERFDLERGGEAAVSKLYHLAQETVGSSLTKDLVRSLVKAYLHVALGR